MFIVSKNNYSKGQRYRTSRDFTCASGTIVAGSEVEIIGVSPGRGYDIRDIDRGFEMYEVGWAL